MIQKRVRSAGTIPIARVLGSVCIGMVQSPTLSTKPAPYVFPKGHVQAGESSIETAFRETYEEMGLTGIILDTPVYNYSYVVPFKEDHGNHPEDVGAIKTVTLYPLLVGDVGTATTPRRWFNIYAPIPFAELAREGTPAVQIRIARLIAEETRRRGWISIISPLTEYRS